MKALEIAIEADDRRGLLQEHVQRFREGVEKAGFTVLKGETPIIPVMLGDARLAQKLAQALDDLGVFVAGFFFPVVPKGAGAHPHPDVGGADDRGHRLCDLGLHRGRQVAGDRVRGGACQETNGSSSRR